jgi:putative membrane-bound dehydrogenase-like protein
MDYRLFMKSLYLYTSLITLGLSALAQIDKDPDVSPLSPLASQKTLQVETPFNADLVASEPMVNEPIVMAWGGDGALYVVELRGYMQDADHTGAQEPVGQVVRLEDSNGDGIMDKQTVFVDKLVEPRSIMAIKGGILVGAPPNIFFCKDTTNDGVADVRKSIYDRYSRRGGNIEHKDNALMWGIDNWIYNAKSATRYKYIQDDKGGKIVEGQTGFRGQWGLTQDNIGNIYATGNTTPWVGEQIAYEYLMHNKLVHDDTFSLQPRKEEGFNEVWPLIGTPDVQGGPGAIRTEDNTLRNFTAIGGQAIFRGDKLGQEMVGQYIIPEPVGRLVRRAQIVEEDGFRKLVNPLKNQQKEFIASTDPNFRPVNAFTGPDGCLYIIDMYRGIIQDGNWTRPGSYLRKEIMRRGLVVFTYNFA